MYVGKRCRKLVRRGGIYSGERKVKYRLVKQAEYLPTYHRILGGYMGSLERVKGRVNRHREGSTR